jgi:hypothetical protein
MKTYFKIIFLFAAIGISTGCANYLDIIPDDIATMDNAFSNRANAEKFLFGCFHYLPNPADAFNQPSMVGSDEFFWNQDNTYVDFDTYAGGRIALGYQNSNDPYMNYWDGELFKGIRDCNIFFENVGTVPDLEEEERIRWIAEVKFLKAYFHFFLMQMYGPIPLMRENVLVSASPDEVRVYREPIDDVVNYIVQLLDEAAKDLPLEVFSTSITEAGRITKPIALAVKAKALVWAASPLFNGNPDYADFKDNRGVQLVPAGSPDVSKWQRAATAIRNAIDTAHLAGHSVMYEAVIPSSSVAVSEATRLKYVLRGAVTEKFNPEIIWPSTQSIPVQRLSMPRLGTGTYVYMADITELSATLKIAEQFYSNNGIPIDEDPEWVARIGGSFANRYETQVAGGVDHQFYIRTNETTAKLNFYREPRFYAYVGFDRGIFEGAGATELNSYYLLGRATEYGGYVNQASHIMTGYYLKKLVNTRTTQVSASYYEEFYSFPIIRLTDLYLLYAEALNEAKSAPDAEVWEWIDAVRDRAGLNGVVESWSKSSVPSKPLTQSGMRDIIKQERLIELCFEGHRMHDLRRWKDALRYMNTPIQGWNYLGTTAENYYKVTTYWNQRVYTTKEYLWPLKTATLTINGNLVQNPGWN